MATVSFVIKSKRTFCNVYLRFLNGKQKEILFPIGVYIEGKHWDKKKHRVKKTSLMDKDKRFALNLQLAKLKIHIMELYNKIYMSGGVPDRFTFEKSVQDFFNRPAHEDKMRIKTEAIYLTDFSRFWMKEKAKKYRYGRNGFLSKKSIGNYNNAISQLEEFEGNEKIKMTKVNGEVLQDFADWLLDQDYSPSTVKKKIDRILFFCNRANDLRYSISDQYSEPIFVEEKEKDYNEQYLNEQEIDRLYEWDLSYDERLENCRDLFLISLRTGLRISDFNHRLNTSNINDRFIEIKTKKTNTWVSIPIHSQVEAILEKRNGEFPETMSDFEYNQTIREIGLICEFNEKVRGAVYKNENGRKRKVVGTYRRYELFTSHMARKSMATSLYGKIPNTDIMAIMGWSDEKMLLRYAQKNNRESANVLKSFWANKN